MKILHCILSREYAGSEAYMCQLAAMQAAARHDVVVVVKGGGGAGYVRRVVAECGGARVVVIPGWLPSVFDRMAIRGVMKRVKPEIVHSHLGRAAKRAGAAARGAGVKHVATLHLNWRADYADCDGVVCVARWQRRDIPQSYRGKVAVVWNWVEREDEKTRKRVGEGRGSGKESRDLADSPTRFLSVGRLVPNKGMDVLIAAFRWAFPPKENVRLVIVGAGPEVEHLEKLAEGDARIDLAGYRPDVMRMYDEFDVYVSAARYEPFGLTLLEAMRAGCRLVCTKTEGPREFLKDYDVAWAEVSEVASLAKALKLAAKKGKGRVPWDMSPFAPARALKEIERFYRDVLEQRP